MILIAVTKISLEMRYGKNFARGMVGFVKEFLTLPLSVTRRSQIFKGVLRVLGGEFQASLHTFID